MTITVPAHRSAGDNRAIRRSLLAVKHRFGRFNALVDLWIERRRGRIALARMEPHRLDDIGIGGEDAGREARRPFWDGGIRYR